MLFLKLKDLKEESKSMKRGLMRGIVYPRVLVRVIQERSLQSKGKVFEEQHKLEDEVCSLSSFVKEEGCDAMQD